MRALREQERRGLRSFTIGVSEDDHRAIAEYGYEGAVSADQDQQEQAISLFITTCSPAQSVSVTALRRLQRRFSNDVTAVATPFRSSGK
jgi:hypothetical protein